MQLEWKTIIEIQRESERLIENISNYVNIKWTKFEFCKLL